MLGRQHRGAPLLNSVSEPALSRAFALLGHINAELGARVEQQCRAMPGLSKATGQTPARSDSIAAAT